MPSPTRVQGSFEPDALAAAIAGDILKRAADTVVLTIDRLDDDGRELNQLQKIALVEAALSSFDGTQAKVRDEIDRELELNARVDAERAEKGRLREARDDG